MSEREHIPTVASEYGFFLNALHDRRAVEPAKLPRASVRGASILALLGRKTQLSVLGGAVLAVSWLAWHWL